MTWRPVIAIVNRELRKLFRQRARLISAMARPMIWLLVIGSGVGSMLHSSQQEGYLTFLVPGVVAMTLLFASLLSALTLVYDKEFGVMRMMMIAPISRHWIVLSKLLAATLIAVIQATLLLLILFALQLTTLNIIFNLFFPILLTAICCAAIGGLIAVWSKTIDNFAVMMNFFIFPTFFLSGALYPVSQLPGFLGYVVLINPFSYGVDLLKHSVPNINTDFSVTTDVTVLISFSIVAIITACWKFSRAPALESLFHHISKKKR